MPSDATSPSDLVILGAGLATPVAAGRPAVREVAGAAIAVRGGRIAWAGPAAGLPPGWERAERLDASGLTLLPGLVDAHTHAVFAGWREDEFALRVQGATYAEIAARGGGIVRTMAATREADDATLRELLSARLDRMLLQGVTTVEVKSGYGLDRDTELRQLRAVKAVAASHPGRVVATYLGAHAVPPELRDRRDAYVDAVVGDVLPRVAEEGLAEACDVFCDQGAFTVAESRRVLAAARGLGLKLKVHADELTSCGGAELAAEMGAVSAEHLLHASDAGVRAMAEAGVVAVLLPATAFLLREAPARAERFRAAGCAMAVGTDFNPGSSPCESLALAASIACVANGLTPDEALAAVTLHGAAACGLAAETGSLEPGKRADVVAIDAPSHRHLPYRFGANLVRHVVAGGRIVVRDGCRTS